MNCSDKKKLRAYFVFKSEKLYVTEASCINYKGIFGFGHKTKKDCFVNGSETTFFLNCKTKEDNLFVYAVEFTVDEEEQKKFKNEITLKCKIDDENEFDVKFYDFKNIEQIAKVRKIEEEFIIQEQNGIIKNITITEKLNELIAFACFFEIDANDTVKKVICRFCIFDYDRKIKLHENYEKNKFFVICILIDQSIMLFQ